MKEQADKGTTFIERYWGIIIPCVGFTFWCGKLQQTQTEQSQQIAAVSRDIREIREDVNALKVGNAAILEQNKYIIKQLDKK